MPIRDKILESEIESHSSLLTNRRLDILFQKADIYSEACWQSPGIENIKAYHANLRSIFIKVMPVFDVEAVKKIQGIFREYYTKFYGFIPGEDEEASMQNVIDCIDMVTKLDHVYLLIVAYLQKQRYFFRTGEKEARSIDDAINVMEQGGGVFGGKIGKADAPGETKQL